MSFATTCSPSSFPPISSKRGRLRQNGETAEMNDARTLENNGLSWHPEVAKCSLLRFRFEKYRTSLISENPDLSCIPEILDRHIFKVAAILARRSGETFIEARVLLEGNTFFVLEAAEVPKNFFRTCIFTEHLCYSHEITKGRSNRVGAYVQRYWVPCQ